MSNYIFGFIKKASVLTKKNIERLFCESVYIEDLCDGFFFRVSRDNVSSTSYTRGIKIDKAFRECFFSGGKKSGRMHSFLEGSYIDQTINGDVLSISTDKFGLYNILYTKCENEIFISDSLLVLTELRKLTLNKNTLNKSDFIARSWMNSITYSLISEETGINEIKYLLPGYQLNIDFGQWRLSIDKGCDLITLNNSTKGYYETIQEESAHILGIFKELAEYYNLSMAVSGGLDSRVLLALSHLLTNIYPSRCKAYIGCSKKTNLADYLVVEEIASKYGLPLNIEPYKKNTTVRVSKGIQWAISSLGIYDPLYSSGYYKKDPETVLVGGHSAEVFKGNYGWRSIASVVNDIADEEVAKAFEYQVQKNKEKLNIDQYPNIASEILYLYFRSAIHGSRFKLISLFTMRPLLINSFINISYTNFQNSNVVNPNMLSQDLVLALSPSIACEVYDNPNKNITEKHKIDTLRKLDSNYVKYYKYKLIGSTHSLTNEPISFSLSVAKKRCFDNNDFNLILNNHMPAIEHISEKYGVNHIVVKLKEYITNSDIKTIKEEAAIGKLLLLSLVD